MNEKELKAMLSLLMCSDPWPTDNKAERLILHQWADNAACQLGYSDWIDAYHKI